ncbi:MAG TPA: BrnA antitoxin family protein [Stellaceae bacterium]|nr:BrnA antitoxin family protein [Stellaceae bacterium]
MAKNVSHTSKRSRKTASGDRTDWRRLRRQSDEETAAAIERDPDAAPLLDDSWFAGARFVPAPEKELISIRVDKDVLDFFRRGGAGYQTRINEVLRAFATHRAPARKARTASATRGNKRKRA